jgi:hypothetical protein
LAHAAEAFVSTALQELVQDWWDDPEEGEGQQGEGSDCSRLDEKTAVTGPPRPRAQSQTLTIGQLARRWGVSVDRVRKLVQGGRLPGAFAIPSAGRYGATVKVPLATVLQLETEDWAVVPDKQRAWPKPSRRRDDSGPALKHFPKLASPGPAAGSRADAEC